MTNAVNITAKRPIVLGIDGGEVCSREEKRSVTAISFWFLKRSPNHSSLKGKKMDSTFLPCCMRRFSNTKENVFCTQWKNINCGGIVDGPSWAFYTCKKSLCSSLRLLGVKQLTKHQERKYMFAEDLNQALVFCARKQMVSPLSLCLLCHGLQVFQIWVGHFLGADFFLVGGVQNDTPSSAPLWHALMKKKLPL